MTLSMLSKEIKSLKNLILTILKESKSGQLIKDGINTAIIGKPNVGKSSLLNYMLGEDKAIVTDIAGTTRDIVEGKYNLNGILLNIIDTAGIRETNDIVETIGVNKSKELIEKADLILYILNNNEEITKEEQDILKQLENKKYIVIINKIDLESKLNIDTITTNNVVKMSALNHIGLDELTSMIEKMFNLEQFELKDLTYLTSARSVAILKQISNQILEIEKSIDNQVPIDLIEIDLKNIWDKLGEIIGESYDDELIDQIFSQFCLGK